MNYMPSTQHFRACLPQPSLLQVSELYATASSCLYLILLSKHVFAKPIPVSCVQIGIFQVVYLGATADEAYQRVQPLQPFFPFRDASCGPPSFNLTVLHCIQVVH